MCLHLFFKMPSLISVIAKGLPAVTLDLGKVVDIGIVAEKSLARRGVRGLWSRDLNEVEVMAIVQSAIVSPETTWADLYNHWPQNLDRNSRSSLSDSAFLSFPSRRVGDLAEDR